MPPKCRFSKEEIIQAALNMVRRDGIDSVTARSLAAELGSSTKPIFSVFENMDQVIHETVMAARDVYTSYARKGINSTPPFMGVGVQYLRFAREEPRLFQLLFMSRMPERLTPETALPKYDERYGQVVDSIQSGFGVDPLAAGGLYRHMWIYTHGIATLMVTGVCDFTDEEIGQMLTQVFLGLLSQENQGGEGR